MKMKIKLLFVCITIGLALLGCEINGLEEETSVQELELVPKESSNQQKAKTGANQASSPYSCLISTLAADEADYNYWNQSFWVHFPKPAIDKAEGKTTFKAFSFSSEKAGSKAGSWAGKDNVVRVAQCVIPDSDLAEILLENQLRKFGKGTWLESQAKTKNTSNQNGSQINSAPYWECSEYFVTVVCQVDSQTGELTNCVITDVRCISYELVYDDPVGGGGGSGGPSDDPGECDPTGTEPCYNDGGGGSIPPPEPDPCDEHPVGDPDRPVYCDKPCETNDLTLNKLAEMQVLENLWTQSFGEFTNGQPPPQNERKEFGGWLVIDNGQQKFVNFPEELKSSICSIKNVPPPPQGAIAIIHTHPMFPTERVKVASCVDRTLDAAGITDTDIRTQWLSIGVRYNQEPSRSDLAYAKEHKITSYYLDGTLIEKYYDGTAEQQIADIKSRCGY